MPVQQLAAVDLFPCHSSHCTSSVRCLHRHSGVAHASAVSHKLGRMQSRKEKVMFFFHRLSGECYMSYLVGIKSFQASDLHSGYIWGLGVSV